MFKYNRVVDKLKERNKDRKIGALVALQLAKQSLPTPKVGGSNPIIGEVFIGHYQQSTVLKRKK